MDPPHPEIRILIEVPCGDSVERLGAPREVLVSEDPPVRVKREREQGQPQRGVDLEDEQRDRQPPDVQSDGRSRPPEEVGERDRERGDRDRAYRRSTGERLRHR